jgi:Arc/MetJ-type ribon-helix-helix transcriptional regulator
VTEKVSVRIPHELTNWIDAEAERRSVDRSAVINDALRLAATAGEIRQATQLLADLLPMLSSRFDRLENYTVQTLNFGGALARQAGVFDQAQSAFQIWKDKQEGAKNER